MHIVIGIEVALGKSKDIITKAESLLAIAISVVLVKLFNFSFSFSFTKTYKYF